MQFTLACSGQPIIKKTSMKNVGRRRRGGGCLNIAVIVIILILLAFVMIRTCRRNPVAAGAGGVHRQGVVWSDTLTNAASDLKSLSMLDRDVERFLRRWEVTGLSLAVTRGDSLVFAKGYGMADIEAARQMDASTIMRIASASKLVTAAAIMKLVEDGKLTLDSRVFGPDGILDNRRFTDAIRDERIFDITVDNLLQHRGGFSLRAGDPMFNTVEIMEANGLVDPPDNEQLVSIVLGRRLGLTPGEGRRYSNFGYLLLSLIIEKVTGKTYWEYVSDDVLAPAGVFTFVPATNSYSQRDHREARYYGPDTVKVREYNNSGRMVDRVYGGSNINGLMGAGGWVSSAAGFARFVAAIDGDPGVKDILSAASIRLMTDFENEGECPRGWTSADARGCWTRTGTLSSTHACIVRFPEGDCWVILTNSGNWKGHKFGNRLKDLVNSLRTRHLESIPARNLW